MIRRTLMACAAALSAAAVHPGAAAVDAPQTAMPSWRAPQGDPARGEELAQVCVTCHMSNSPQKSPPAPKLRHQRPSYLFFALLAYRDERRQSDIMSPFAQGLSDQDARDLAAYLAGEMFDRPPVVRTDLPGYRVTVRECTLCHGETGIGEMEGMPVLTGQERGYLANALKQYRDGRRTDPTMREIARNLSDQDAAQATEYYSVMDWVEHPR